MTDLIIFMKNRRQNRSMEQIVLIGFGAIGIPIAWHLNEWYGDNFALVATGQRRKKMEKKHYWVNGSAFSAKIVSSADEMNQIPTLAIICVKNYDIESAINDLRSVIAPETILLPLQNGIYAFKRFCEAFPENIVLKGYIQGPNTLQDGENLLFTNAGVTHIGASAYSGDDIVQHVYKLLHISGLDVIVESDIDKMVWKKWMLNVAGNSVTALTGADYSKFRTYEELQTICRKSMREFVEVARAKDIPLSERDIEDIIQYYVSYKGAKKTSMLEDVLHHRRTENEYLAGTLLQMAEKKQIPVPATETLYLLMKAKEEIYLNE
mgnify:CR=1 FL=1